METCARCGHSAPECTRCGRSDPLLGGSIGDRPYCHAFSESEPTCYTLSNWERTEQAPNPAARAARALTADVRQELDRIRKRGSRMEELVKWLRTQIDETEHTTLTRDPREVHAVMEAHRAILNQWESLHDAPTGTPCVGFVQRELSNVVLAVALAYQHRPGFREEWKSNG